MTITDYYVASDAMGSVTAILDEDGNVLERRNYDAFGEMTCMSPDGIPVAESPTEVDVGFQGQIRDEVTGLYQMGYRWYSPTLGRWISRDKVGLYDGANIFAFARSNPTDRSDFFGLTSCKEGEVKNWQILQIYDCYDGQSEEEFKTEMALIVSAAVGTLLLNEKTSLLAQTPRASQEALAHAGGALTEEIMKWVIGNTLPKTKFPEMDDTTSNLLQFIKHKFKIRKAAIFAFGTDICVKAQWDKCEGNCFWKTKWIKKSKIISLPIGRQQSTSSEADKDAASEKAKKDLFK